MIAASELSKVYGTFRALDKVSFEVRRGEVVGFLGPNGAGKSTTMRILTCFLAPTGGTAKLNGLDIFDNSLEVRQSLGYLPQRAPLYTELSVFEYLRFAASLRQLDRNIFMKRAKTVVEVCGLAQVLGKEIRQLSHGYRQRVGLAQALIHDPPILILDEPTSDLDPNEKAEFLDYLKQIGRDRTVLLSTHNLSEVESACGRAIIVSRGRVVADGTLDELRARSGKVRYTLTIEDSQAGGAYRGQAWPVSDVSEALAGVAGVSTVEQRPSQGKSMTFEVSGADDSDLRPQISQLVLQKGWMLLELRRDSQTLEDVFRALTVGDARRNRKIGAPDIEGDDEDDEDDDDDTAAPEARA
jgi:ABC-2 type transport system ATP-binding protein